MQRKDICKKSVLETMLKRVTLMLPQSSIKSSTHSASAESLGSPVLGQASAMCSAQHGGKGCCP